MLLPAKFVSNDIDSARKYVVIGSFRQICCRLWCKRSHADRGARKGKSSKFSEVLEINLI